MRTPKLQKLLSQAFVLKYESLIKPNKWFKQYFQSPLNIKKSLHTQKIRLKKWITCNSICQQILKNNQLQHIPFYVRNFMIKKNHRKYLAKTIITQYHRLVSLRIAMYRYSFKINLSKTKLPKIIISKIILSLLLILLIIITIFHQDISPLPINAEIISKLNEQPQNIEYRQAIINDLRKQLNQVQAVRIKMNTGTKLANTVTLVYKDKSRKSLQYPNNPNDILRLLQFYHESNSSQPPIKILLDKNEYGIFNAFGDMIQLITPLFGIAITIFIFRKISPDSFINKVSGAKKNYKFTAIKDINVKFKDVAGMEQAKKQITEFVDFLQKSDKYIEMGARIPKGALLTGPPGTGKTMLAKACAGEAGVAFFNISGSEFVEIFVGLGASKVRNLFAKAREEAPSIIFIDQIDAIGKKRQTSRNQEKDSTLNQLLVQMDGFSTHETVIVLAATNRQDILDSALTRPGRFDRMVEITLPEVTARQQIFMVHLKPLKIDPSKQLKAIAKRLSELSPGFSGADIANLCNQAAIIATRNGHNYISDKDFEDAAERITAGYEKKNLTNKQTRKRVAYHEAGHAVSGWFLKGGDPLIKLTIIPRSKGALGYAQYMPKTAYLKSKEDLVDQVAIMLGGITSQQIFFGNMSSGGSDDLQKVYQLTRKMIASFGMGKQTYNITIDEQSQVQKQSLYFRNKIDSQMLQIVEQAKNRCHQILSEKQNIIESLAAELLQKETINSSDIIRIMGQRPVFQ